MKEKSTLWAILTLTIYIIADTANAQWNLITAEDDSMFYDAVYFTNDSTGFVVGTSGHNNSSGGIILRTTNSGLSWDTTILSKTYPLKSIHFPGNDTGYAIGSSDSVYRTTDAGQTWNAFNTGFYGLNSVFFLDNQTGYASRENNIILIKTTDGGLNWFEDTTIPNLGGSQIYFPSPNTGYIIAGWAVFETTDGGSNWSKKFIDIIDTTMTTDTSYQSIFFVNDILGFIGGSITEPTPPNSGVIAKTTDGGLTWNAQIYPEMSIIRSIYFVNASIGYAVGTGTILKTTDGGENWYPQQVTASFKGVYCTNDTTCYAVSSWPGAIYKTTNGGGPVGRNEVSINEGNEITIYPNPASDKIFIKGNFDAPALFELYDITGRKALEQTLTGINSQVNISHLSKGFYIYKLATKKTGYFTGKIVKH